MKHRRVLAVAVSAAVASAVLTACSAPEVQPVPDATEVAGQLSVWGGVFAACVLASVPVLIVYVVFNRRITESIVQGSGRES